MSLFDDCAGVICNGCGEESLRIIEGKCLTCARNQQTMGAEQVLARIEKAQNGAAEALLLEQELSPREKHLREDAKRHGLWIFPKRQRSGV